MTGMCLGILETGRLPAELIPVHGNSPEMFQALLTPAGPSIRYQTFSVFENRFPEDIAACDGWLVTGSPASVLDHQPWMARLQGFLAQAYRGGVPIIGICFGHQILAAALGGRVERSVRGWGLGRHDYRVLRSANWMGGDVSHFSIPAMHEDQVAAIPSHADVLAGTDFCPNAAVAYGDTAISFQGHPEFTVPFARDLIGLRRGVSFSGLQADQALASLALPMDSAVVADWMVTFLNPGAG